MPRPLRQRVLDRVVPVIAGATVVGFAIGSSSVPSLTHVGHVLRWALLGLLFVCAAAWGPSLRALPGSATASAAALAGLAALSTAWSVEPRTTFERAVSLALLFGVCVLLAAAVREKADRAADVLWGLLGGAAAVGIAGLLLLVVDHGRAVQAATYQAPARFNGLGQDPNTVALLFAVAVPIAVWALLRSRRRVLAAAVLALLAGTIVASGSHGGLVAGAVGALVVVVTVLGRSRAALVAAAVVVACAGAGVGIQAIPKPATADVSSPATTTTGPKAKPGYLNAEQLYPLDADVGQPLPGGGQPPVRRGFFGSSGRLDAWRGALHEAARRPVVGHGFGTEQAVFIDRYYSFVGSLPENSYIGLALQLGIAGVVALAVLVVILFRAGLGALRGPRRDVAACALGVLAAGLLIAVVQSYLYSVGNIATAALWIPAFMLPAVAPG
ncbi:MAG: O-antigen ligase family protein [Gaiellaceae bacterium]